METLQILTNNHLGASFWEQRTGLIDSIQLNPINLKVFNNLIETQSNFILLDFYFSKISLQKQLSLIAKIKQSTETIPGHLKLFILSPVYADSDIEHIEFNNKVIVCHNFTDYFLKTLLAAGQNKLINKSLLKSM